MHAVLWTCNYPGTLYLIVDLLFPFPCGWLSILRIVPVDLSDAEATRCATDQAKNCFGKIDILINNAGLLSSSTHPNRYTLNEVYYVCRDIN